jgi:hypothetical protein
MRQFYFSAGRLGAFRSGPPFRNLFGWASAALAVAVALLWLPAQAQAACTPTSPVNNAEVTCTGTTADQNALAGYGTLADTGNTITVVPDAIVTGANTGIVFNSGTVLNSGSIIGTGLNGIATTTTVTVINSGSISGGIEGIRALTAATVTNSGSISGGTFGVFAAGTASVTNSGSISAGGDGIQAITATVNNSGTIVGTTFAGIEAVTANVSNSGRIGGSAGIIAVTAANVTNAGIISGNIYGIRAATGSVTNSGVISGNTAALQLFGNPDTLTLLPGSTIVGAINLGGGGDTINFRGGNHNLTFDTLAGATVTSTTPFVVSGNRAVAIDVTPFAMADRNLLDFSRAVSSAVPDIEGSFTATTAAGSSGALAFAGPDTDVSLGDDSLPGLAAYADGSTLPFKSPTTVYGNGTVLWARTFVGKRVQDADGALLETHNRFYGGMLGGGWQVRPNLRLGLFLGAGETRSQVDPGYGETKSTLVFAGLTGRYTWGASFLRFGLQGGHSKNDSTRNINNNLVTGGIENATASFDGWYVTPEATFGHHFALGAAGGAAYTLTPSLTVRYLHASLDGYTETGTTAPLTVSDRTADSFEERGQIKLTRTQIFAPTEVLKTSIFGGVLADQRVGGNSVDAVLLGQAIPFAVPGDDSVWGGFAGLGLEWRTGRVTLFASTEYLALSDSSSVFSGQGGLRIAF